MITQIVPLTTARWENARQRTETTIRERLTMPDRKLFGGESSKYPLWLIVLIGVLLVIVALAAWFLSAGKEIAIAHADLTDLVSAYPILTVDHIAWGTLALLALTEAGALLFGFASRVLSADHRIQVALRVFQGVCVAIALIANISITNDHPSATDPAFDWTLTIVAPILVVGLGIILEETCANWLRARQSASDAFNQAVKLYQDYQNAPGKHPDFNAVLGAIIIEELIRASKHNRELIPTIIDSDPQSRQAIAFQEFQRHQWIFDPANRPAEITAISGISTEIAVISKVDAVALIVTDPQLLDVPGAELVARYGGSEATWSRAKTEYRNSVDARA